MAIVHSEFVVRPIGPSPTDDEQWLTIATAELGTGYMHIETGQQMVSLEDHILVVKKFTPSSKIYNNKHNTLSDIISDLSEVQREIQRDVIIRKGKVKQKVILVLSRVYNVRVKDYV